MVQTTLVIARDAAAGVVDLAGGLNSCCQQLLLGGVLAVGGTVADADALLSLFVGFILPVLTEAEWSCPIVNR